MASPLFIRKTILSTGAKVDVTRYGWDANRIFCGIGDAFSLQLAPGDARMLGELLIAASEAEEEGAAPAQTIP